MDDILDTVRDAVEGTIDYDGQHLVTLINYALMSTFGVIAFFVGIVTTNVYYSLYVGLAGLVVTMLATVPPYPWYNRSKVAWLPPRKVAGTWYAVQEGDGYWQGKKTS